MLKRNPYLSEFLAMERVHNLYIQFRNIDCYMRKGRVIIDEQIRTALTIANISNRKRTDNFRKLEEYSRTGLFREFHERVRKAAVKHGYEGVYVELVHNEFLPDVLIRYGYRRVNIRQVGNYQENNFWFPVREEQDERSG